MANTILGLFDNPLDARRAMEQIHDSELKTHDVSIISRATESGAPISSVDDVSAGEGATVGAVWGGLVGLAALLIPGVGPFIALGALGAVLTCRLPRASGFVMSDLITSRRSAHVEPQQPEPRSSCIAERDDHLPQPSSLPPRSETGL